MVQLNLHKSHSWWSGAFWHQAINCNSCIQGLCKDIDDMMDLLWLREVNKSLFYYIISIASYFIPFIQVFDSNILVSGALILLQFTFLPASTIISYELLWIRWTLMSAVWKRLINLLIWAEMC